MVYSIYPWINFRFIVFVELLNFNLCWVFTFGFLGPLSCCTAEMTNWNIDSESPRLNFFVRNLISVDNFSYHLCSKIISLFERIDNVCYSDTILNMVHLCSRELRKFPQNLCSKNVSFYVCPKELKMSHTIFVHAAVKALFQPAGSTLRNSRLM